MIHTMMSYTVDVRPVLLFGIEFTGSRGLFWSKVSTALNGAFLFNLLGLD